MTYEQKCKELDQQIRSIQKIMPLDCYIKDGIVDIARWRQQAIRPLFIGKEAYEKADSTEWAINDWLNSTPENACKASPRTWQTTAYVSFGLQHGLMSFDQMPKLRNDSSVTDALRSIAFINVGKYGGGTTTPLQRLQELYQQNRAMLHSQIGLIQPNIIIGWNTLWLFERDKDFSPLFSTGCSLKQTNGSAEYWLADGRLYVDAYHPAARQLAQQQYVDDILVAVKSNSSRINTSLPEL